MKGGPPLIVTRPEPGNAATIQRARAMGFPAHAMPLFAARPVGWRAPAAQDFDALLLTSAFAAREAGPEIARLATLPVYAVGDATARAAEAAGLTVAMTGTADAQPLLDAMVSQDIRAILWLCGRDRSAFDACGAAITPLPCYALDPVAPPAEWAALIAAPAVLLAHSAREALPDADSAWSVMRDSRCSSSATRAATLRGAARQQRIGGAGWRPYHLGSGR